VPKLDLKLKVICGFEPLSPPPGGTRERVLLLFVYHIEVLLKKNVAIQAEDA